MQLRRRERALIVATGCVLCVFGGTVAPRNAAAVAFTGHLESTLRSARSPVPVRPAAVAIIRNPFVADTGAERTIAQPRAGGGPFAPISGVPVLPPNRAADVVPSRRDAPQIVVRAVVVGNRPFAIVDLGGQSVLVRPGDELDGKRVEAIDMAGILLAGNIRLALGQ